ncbi:MAG: hypothetical protein AB7O24_08640 [Kofleriaceae bacterium]
MKNPASLLSRLAVVACVTIPALAHAGNKTLTVLGGDLEPEQIDALRAEASVRGMTLEVLPAAGSADVATVVADNKDVAAVIWVADAGTTLHAQAANGRRTQAPLRNAPSGRAVAAIASSLVDDLNVTSTSPVDVDVTVKVKGAAAAGSSPGLVAATPANTFEPTYFLDLGGLAGPMSAVAVNAGVGRYHTPNSRIAAVGHFVWLPDDIRAYGATLELARSWGDAVRPEAGIRGGVTMITHPDPYSGPPVSTMSGATVYGAGGGVFVGLGVRTSIGTLYARGGADLMRFSTDETVVAPNGSIGIELPLR